MEGNTAGIPPGGIAKRKAAGSCGKGRADREQRAGGGGRGQQAQDQAGAAGAGVARRDLSMVLTAPAASGSQTTGSCSAGAA